MTTDITEHKFISILEYAYKNKLFTENELCKELNLTKSDFNFFVRGLAHHDPNQTSGEEQKWTISYEAFLNYLEYIELKEARESSMQAKNLSLIAIAISGLLAAFSIGISLYQLNTVSTVEIVGAQYEGLRNNPNVATHEATILNASIPKTNAPVEDLTSELNEDATNKPIKPTQ